MPFQKGKSGNPDKKFTRTNQPSGKRKSAGKLRAKVGQELLQAIFELPFKGAQDGKIKKQIADYFDIPESDITNEMMMDFRQIEKAVSKADTAAYNALKNRLYGLPKQQIDAQVTASIENKSTNELKSTLAEILSKLE